MLIVSLLESGLILATVKPDSRRDTVIRPMKYFSDLSISCRIGTISMAMALGLRATKKSLVGFSRIQ